jgi:predicted small lipoprotein YifL
MLVDHVREPLLSTRRPISRLVVFAALAAALALAGCGRKGPLDAPPSAAIEGQATAAPAAAPLPGRQPGVTSEGQAIAPPGQKRSIPPLDWLID